MKPLHRYDGVLEMTEQKLEFTGRDVKEKKEFKLEIEIGNITDIHFGFDCGKKTKGQFFWINN